MGYQKYFTVGEEKPQKQVSWPAVEKGEGGADAGARGARPGDRRDGMVYVYNDKIELAVNVALATRRPLLVRGPSGCGKSSLAFNVAHRLGWRYYEQVITSNTQARDLLWEFDSLRRLSDAQGAGVSGEAADYVEPAALWWAFDPASAARRGLPAGAKVEKEPADPGLGPKAAGAVVLLDEIDKADPDVPNNLLVPLGSFEFRVKETGLVVKACRPLLVFITTNDERTLPTAFMRRCVVMKLNAPNKDLLIKIAESHYGPDKLGIYGPVAEKVLEAAAAEKVAPGAAALQSSPSTAEYLDTVCAFIDLGLSPESKEAWEIVSGATLWKRQTPS